MFDSRRFKRLNNFGEKWIRNFRNDQAKNAASARNQGARLPVRIIPELVNRLPNPLGQLRIDRGHPIDRARYGCGRYASSLGNIANVQESSFAGSIASGTVYAILLLLIVYGNERHARVGKIAPAA